MKRHTCHRYRISVIVIKVKRYIDHYEFSVFQELKAFIEGAGDGIILFCLGISTEMTSMIERDLQSLFTVFGELKQRVIAKGHYSFLIFMSFMNNFEDFHILPSFHLRYHIASRIFKFKVQNFTYL